METVSGIVLASGERVVRLYEATKLESPQAKGFLIATNRRLIFTGESIGKHGMNNMSKEINIDKVTGVQSFFRKTVSKTPFFLFGILALISILLLASTMFAAKLLGVAGIAAAAFMTYRLIHSQVKCMYIVITTENQHLRDSTLSSHVSRKAGDLIAGSFITLHAGPVQDTERMIGELGALISDIQTLGDRGMDRWVNKMVDISPSITIPDEQITELAFLHIICENCGNPWQASDKFCGNCGADLHK